MHHLHRLTGLAASYLRRSLLPACVRPCGALRTSLRRLLSCSMSSDAVTPAEGPVAAAVTETVSETVTESVTESVTETVSSSAAAGEPTRKAGCSQGSVKIDVQPPLLPTVSGSESQTAADGHHAAEAGGNPETSSGEVITSKPDNAASGSEKNGVLEEAADSTLSAGTTSEGLASEAVSTTPMSTDQELVNSLVLDKRKRDEDDESPELKKVKLDTDDPKLDPRLACLLQAKLETKALKAKRPGFTDERYTETSYWFENGLRKVYPYYFTFTTFTKGRWVGEKILDVFAREFRAHPAEEYERCIRAGTLTVNYQKVDVDHRLRHNDLLANVVHRHETPVLSRPMEIIHLSDELVVLDKPCSLPVHPCGRYRHNTVVFILAKEHGLKNLRTIHRLDRLTSGLLMFGRTPAKARDMEQQIRTRQVTKEYVCRVEGEFPSEPISCKEPIEVVSYKIGVCKVSPKGKECLTEFSRANYNGRSSVVICRPHTGRMHQIRVHLQYLGFPIINDPLYNHTVFGPGKGKGGTIDKSDEQLIQDLIAIHNAENWLGMDGDVELSMFKPKEAGDVVPLVAARCAAGSPPAASPGPSDPAAPPTVTAATEPQPPGGGGSCSGAGESGEAGAQADGARPPAAVGGALRRVTPFRPELLATDPHCYECKVRYRDPKPSDLVMYLHALKYAGPGWEYETKMPTWASEDWRDPDGKA